MGSPIVGAGGIDIGVLTDPGGFNKEQDIVINNIAHSNIVLAIGFR